MSKELIVITGAGSGIGRATAQAFSKEGHPLLLLDLNAEATTSLNLPNSLCEEVNVTDRDAFKAAIEKGEKAFGPVGCLINCAGLMLLGQVQDQNPAEWDKMFNVNVNGVLAGMHAVLDKMVARQHGTIINISSIAGIKTFPNHAVYCGTKFAVSAITENVREEVAKYGVRMITIEPGVVETALLSHTTSDKIKEDYEAWKKEVGQVLKPEDIARAMVFAYSQPEYITIRELVIAATRQEP